MEPSLFVTVLMASLGANLLAAMTIAGLVMIRKNEKDVLAWMMLAFSAFMGVATVIAFQSPL